MPVLLDIQVRQRNVRVCIMELPEYEVCGECGAMIDGTAYAWTVHQTWHDLLDKLMEKP